MRKKFYVNFSVNLDVKTGKKWFVKKLEDKKKLKSKWKFDEEERDSQVSEIKCIQTEINLYSTCYCNTEKERGNAINGAGDKYREVLQTEGNEVIQWVCCMQEIQLFSRGKDFQMVKLHRKYYGHTKKFWNPLFWGQFAELGTHFFQIFRIHRILSG